MAGGFELNTRQQFFQLSQITKPMGGGRVQLQLNKVGLAARLWLLISGSVSGTLSNANALGMASVVNQLRVFANNGNSVFDMSGAEYHYLLRNFHGAPYFDPFPAANARSAVTATTFDVSFLVEFQMNQREPIGFIVLQNEQTTITLDINFESDANVATGATVAATVVPVLEYFTLPADVKDYPPIDIAHICIADAQTVAATGDYTYTWLRGNTYLQTLHGLGIGVSGADNWNRYRLRVQGGTYLEDHTVGMKNAEYALAHPAARLAGVIPVDFMGSGGQGALSRQRDYLNSAMLTDVASIITATATGTLYTVRRQLVKLM